MPLSASLVLEMGKGYMQMIIICPLGIAVESMLGPSSEGKKEKNSTYSKIHRFHGFALNSLEKSIAR